jgi:GH24 family phage-related lysozyme (muramidase)
VNRRPIFSAVKLLRNGQGFTMAEVRQLDAAIDEALGAIAPPAPAPTSGRKVGKRGIELMHQFEGCKLEAYPDPGSHDGNPWTIGWGSTGPGIAKGVRWTQQQCDERFERDLNEKYAAGVDKMLGDTPTTQNQFDALVGLAYNIGLSALKGSTVMRKHKAGDYQNAARAFVMWNKNDGKVMRGLTRRRLAESDLYDDL